jgi:hypothetical protein
VAIPGALPGREAWSWRKSCTRTLKLMPEALTAGRQMRVRKVVAGDCGAGRRGAEQVVSGDVVGVAVGGDVLEPGLADAEVWWRGVTRMRSLTARPKIEDNSTWYFWIDRVRAVHRCLGDPVLDTELTIGVPIPTAFEVQNV